MVAVLDLLPCHSTKREVAFLMKPLTIRKTIPPEICEKERLAQVKHHGVLPESEDPHIFCEEGFLRIRSEVKSDGALLVRAVRDLKNHLVRAPIVCRSQRSRSVDVNSRISRVEF